MTNFPTSNLLPQRRDLTARVVGDEVLVRDPSTGNIHFLNPTAAVVWECCDGATTVSDCEARVRERFDIPTGADLSSDISATIADFRQRGLLDAVPAA